MKSNISNNTKVTLTIGQLKRLVKESKSMKFVKEESDEAISNTVELALSAISEGFIAINREISKLEKIALQSGDKLDAKYADLKKLVKSYDQNVGEFLGFLEMFGED